MSRAFDLLTKRLGAPVIASKLAALLPGAPIAAKPAPPARQAFFEAVGGARARVSMDTFRAVFEDLSSGVEGDFAFAKLLANCWDVAPWPAAASVSAAAGATAHVGCACSAFRRKWGGPMR